MISVEEEELANKVFQCFKKRRFTESSKEQSNEIEGILYSVNDGESRRRIVNWRHTEVMLTRSVIIQLSHIVGL